jgi:hypothetical protein
MTRKSTEYRSEPSSQFTAGQLFLLVTFIAMWLGITVRLGSMSVLFWGCGVAMTAILRPSHQRRRTPESVTDVMSVAVSWAVAWGAAGVAMDLRVSAPEFMGLVSWTVLGELTGFYLGLVWVLVLLLARYVERLSGQFGRPRPTA